MIQLVLLGNVGVCWLRSWNRYCNSAYSKM